MKVWKLDIASKSYCHLEAYIEAKEFNVAMRRATKEIENAKTHFGDLGWFLYSLREIKEA